MSGGHVAASAFENNWSSTIWKLTDVGEIKQSPKLLTYCMTQKALERKQKNADNWKSVRNEQNNLENAAETD